jgi:ubiquinone/menaquinone biosynthesis C-methylase UbiE
VSRPGGAAAPNWPQVKSYYAYFNRTDDLETAIRQIAGDDLNGRWKAAGTLDFIDNPLVPRAFVNQYEVGAGSRVVDVGAGLGGGSRVYAAAGAGVVALDVLPEQTRAHERLNRLFGITSIDVREGDAQALPLPDQSFTHYLSVGALCHTWDRAAVLREAFRVLEPRGRLVIVDYTRGDVPGPDWIAPGFWNLIPLAEYVEHAATAGFDSVETRDVTREYANQVSIYIRLMERARALFEQRFGGPERYEDAIQTYRDFVAGFDRGSTVVSWIAAERPPRG